jgi:hypothetical protein
MSSAPTLEQYVPVDGYQFRLTLAFAGQYLYVEIWFFTSPAKKSPHLNAFLRKGIIFYYTYNWTTQFNNVHQAIELTVLELGSFQEKG